MTLFEGKLPQKRQCEREREQKKRKKETKKERQRASERASSMPNDMVSAGNRARQVDFSHQFCPFCECA